MSHQAAHPMPATNAAQLVLKYLLMNKPLVVKSWRNRIYYFSSGTLFGNITNDLRLWVQKHKHGFKLLRQVIYYLDIKSFSWGHPTIRC
jgi:hypothetical protein